MLWETLSAARDLGRLHDIATVLIRWGFGDVVRRLGMSHALERAGKVLHWGASPILSDMEPPQRVVKALQELGPTFVKLGQLLATRVDLFPPDWIAAFETLQDQAGMLDFEQLRAQLTEDLGADPDSIFAELDKHALAAASIAQVHSAKLVDGTPVILKIRRPDIVNKVEADLRLLARLAELAENNIQELKRFRPTEVVRQFSLSLRRELDLSGECRHAERIAANLQDEFDVVIPRVYWQWSSERLNVQQYIFGISGRQFAKQSDQLHNGQRIAKLGARAILHMVLVNGFFHADPHLGNIIVTPDNKLALVDFGMVGRLSDQRREELIDLLYALVKKDSVAVVDVLLLWVRGSNIDETALTAEVENFLDHYHGLSLRQLDFTAVLIDLTSILREHQLTLPADLALLIKTFISLEGVGRRLDPDFNIVEEATPFMERLVRARYAPSALLKRGASDAQAIWRMFSDVPRDVHALIKSMRRGGMQVHVDLTRLDHFGHKIDRAVSRLTVGIVVAALIVGTAIVSSNQSEITLFGMPILGVVGFLIACVGGIGLLVSAWRSGRD
ncbi:MAG: AarF/UbiB family protein [Gammaproteobacteria bacterium]|nr:AarF/UbiB family protein [Gammaproteobacteria bacterium]